MVKSSIISVDCAKNDVRDIRCGGPIYLGFDFYVEASKEQEMYDFVKEALNKFNIPILSMEMRKGSEIDESKVYTKDKIVACMRKNLGNYPTAKKNVKDLEFGE